LKAYISRVSIVGSDEAEYRSYRETDFRRFVYTWGLVRDARGRALELGASPYFTTSLLRGFTSLDVTLANFFSDDFPSASSHKVVWSPPNSDPRTETFHFDHFNIEREPFPYTSGTFDVVLFCEILEHLLVDPAAAFAEIHRVLRPGGRLLLTTPNVARLENVARLLAGANIYDPYSGHGPYGRHNREYTMAELHRLLPAAGFVINTSFTSDVHPNDAFRYADAVELASTRIQQGLLGQYLFVLATRTEAVDISRPEWLYRNFAPALSRDHQ
jgi:SAM-dependent methyltransferase